MFQFLIGIVKTNATCMGNFTVTAFQFLIGIVKTIEEFDYIDPIIWSFNSL